MEKVSVQILDLNRYNFGRCIEKTMSFCKIRAKAGIQRLFPADILQKKGR